MNITLDFENVTRSTAPGEADISIPIITDNESEFAKVITKRADGYRFVPQDVTEHYVFACEFEIGTVEVYISVDPYLDLIFITRYSGSVDDQEKIKKIVLDYITGNNKED